MLAGRPVEAKSGLSGTSAGAALLARGMDVPVRPGAGGAARDEAAAFATREIRGLAAYAEAWRRRVEERANDKMPESSRGAKG